MENDIEWRFIWKACIDASQKTLLMDKNISRFFPELDKLYGDDKMITFEKAITLECLDKKSDAQKLYEESAEKETGLPVSHWRTRAKYYSERHSLKKTEYKESFCIQWDTFYNMHTYINLHPHIRYLAISSVSRVNNEPEMAVVIFRTCFEICLELYWDLSINSKGKKNTKDLYLGKKVDFLFKDKIDKSLYEDMLLIVDEGNLAAHPFKLKEGESLDPKYRQPKRERVKEKPFKYENEDISKILRAFDSVMKYCDSKATQSGKNILFKDLGLIN